jgi:AraC-like DNA-binding protein/mannose-6-phosphate isomerase-like protein (cupin superfamily)
MSQEKRIKNLLDLKDEYLELGYYYNQKFKNYSVPINSHNRFEIMLVEQGKFDIKFWNEETNKYSETITVKKGQILLIDYNLHHQMEIDNEGCQLYNVEFYVTQKSSSNFSIMPMDVVFKENNALSYMINSTQNHYYICNDHYQIKSIIQQILSEFDDGGCKTSNENFVVINLLIQQLFLAFARSYFEDHKSNGLLYVRKVNLFIANNYQSDIKIEDIAKAVGVNSTHLQKFYKQHTQKTISGYLSRYRIAKSKVLMYNTNFTLIDIAIEVGFNSRQVFFDNFKRVTGQTPNEYRKKKHIIE